MSGDCAAGILGWLYGDWDPVYPLAHSRENFAAFQAAGGRGAFHELPAAAGGHWIVDKPDRWIGVVDAYLARRGLPSAR